MINKIKDWFFSKYGIDVAPKHIWMFLILIASLVILALSLFTNKSSKPKAVPANYDPKNMPKME